MAHVGSGLYARFIAIAVVSVILGSMSSPTIATQPSQSHSLASEPLVSVQPVVETDPMPHNYDAADDPAIWIHPSDPSRSTIIGTDKQGGLAVYDLSGKQLQYLADGKMNNVDLRYNFPLGGERVSIVTVSNQSKSSLSIYRVDPVTRLLEDVAARIIKVEMPVYGMCMYHSPVSGKYYTFVTKSPYPLDSPSANSGEVRQFELFEQDGKVDARKVRTFKVGSDSEGCVADDEFAQLYIAQTKRGLWQYGAEPDAGSTRVSIGTVGDGKLLGELEGVSIYYTSRQTGYLIVSQQCCSSYVVYRREGTHDYVTSFKVASNPAAGIDAVTGTDGLDVTNASLGPLFPQGVLVFHDTLNDPGGSSYTNFKLVPWEMLANAVDLPLTIDTSWDPRAIGRDPQSPTGTPTATPSPASPPEVTMTAQTPIVPQATPQPEASSTIQPISTPLRGDYDVRLPIVSLP